MARDDPERGPDVKTLVDPETTTVTMELDEQIRRYQDLAKRAADLRRYL